MVWGDDQCKTIRTLRPQDLEGCKQECQNRQQCNVIHFKEGVDGDCRLKSCTATKGIPKPDVILVNYVGFCVKKNT